MKLPDLTGTPWRAIVLSEKHGVWTLVSARRYDWLIQTNWNISWGSRTRWQLYAKRNVGSSRATVRMHREIMLQIDPKPEDEAAALFVDHGNAASPARGRRSTRSDHRT